MGVVRDLALLVAAFFIFAYNLIDIEDTIYIQFFILPFLALPLAVLLPALPLVFIFFGNQRQLLGKI
ncbi:MAG: hypothetical protein Q6364_11385 [Candidatus Hermodarchaeota archaeon]|nr:hypothetical protein [Candidatus Hermodarchaeota archaeon]